MAIQQNSKLTKWLVDKKYVVKIADWWNGKSRNCLVDKKLSLKIANWWNGKFSKWHASENGTLTKWQVNKISFRKCQVDKKCVAK